MLNLVGMLDVRLLISLLCTDVWALVPDCLSLYCEHFAKSFRFRKSSDLRFSFITKFPVKINLFRLNKNWFHFMNKAECMLNTPSFTATFLIPCRSRLNMKYLTILFVIVASMLCFTSAYQKSAANVNQSVVKRIQAFRAERSSRIT